VYYVNIEMQNGSCPKMAVLIESTIQNSIA